ncbi:MAG: hypothetical protein V4605_08880 [Pseudomonadota bacterium]
MIKKLDLTNTGILLGGAAVFYLIYKAVNWNKAMNALGSVDGNNQYASAYSDNYDWIQGVKNDVRLTYV